MPSINRLSKLGRSVVKEQPDRARVNWHPGHMFSGMKAMIGKLNTVDCVIEVHDARIPLIGRNQEFRQHLGRIKPHILVLNKSDLADLSKWKTVKEVLAVEGDKNVLLTNLSGDQYGGSTRGYNTLLNKAVELINATDRYNRTREDHFKIMIVGIPNVGKSTLINRLRQHHLGLRGDASKTGNEAGITRHVEQTIKIASRPLIYSLDTPGVLEPSATKDFSMAMKLALCSTINDRALKGFDLANYLIEYLNEKENFTYQFYLSLEKPVRNVIELRDALTRMDPSQRLNNALVKECNLADDEGVEQISWSFVRLFRKGYFGKVMFF